ncbi:MAG: DEAD/DEAH box helicase [Phycisphaeraceae bacterium]|nr:DEAD/DEAH box helicase [Phycisphaeraceae bacterium]
MPDTPSFVSSDSHHSENPPQRPTSPEGGGEGAPSPARKKKLRRKPQGGSSTALPTSEPKGPAPDGAARPKRRRRRKPAGARAEATPVIEGDDDGSEDASPREIIAYGERDPDLFDLERTWEALGLGEKVRKGLAAAGFKYATQIQAQLIPPAAAGRDVLGQAKTGTGKTAAFGLPLLDRVKPGEGFQALVLCPTRELASQISDSLRVLGKFTGLKVCPVFGGKRMSTQIDRLRQNPEIIVGTPGRVMDMAERGLYSFGAFRYVVLDEVDRMLDIGFRDDIRRILKQCPPDRQTMMVSATISPEIEELARRHMRNAEKIVTSSGSLTVKMVEQHYLSVEPWDKKKLLLHLLTHEEPALTLVFCRLKRTVDELAEYLERKQIDVYAMHGDMRQSARENVMRKLREGKLGVVIASDLASRGLDVDGITHVINYDLPEDPEVYVHRIGRTARAGRDGVAWSFVTQEQGKLLTQIEKLINIEIAKMDYPDFVPSPRPEGWRGPPGSGPTPPSAPAKPVESRYAERDVNQKVEQLSQTDQAKLAQKFPGGVIPTKAPPKKMFGKVRTSRSNKL